MSQAICTVVLAELLKQLPVDHQLISLPDGININRDE